LDFEIGNFMAGESDQLQEIAERALGYVAEGNVVGLGSGRAATAFIRALGERVKQGLNARGVPTSLESERLAIELGIPLTTLDEVTELDVDIDGADEIDPQLGAIKGYGGALLREKIVARASKKLVLLVGDEKLVPKLGARGRLPVEAISFGLGATMRHLQRLGLKPQTRLKDGEPFITDNGNLILDCALEPIDDPVGLDRALRDIPGVVETGLFLGIVDAVLVQRSDRVELRERPV
jgi:ribose 5-phosphate isomerase A